MERGKGTGKKRQPELLLLLQRLLLLLLLWLVRSSCCWWWLGCYSGLGRGGARDIQPIGKYGSDTRC